MKSDNLAPAPREIERLRAICAWCKRVLREGDPGAPISHGICEACRSQLSPHEITPEGSVEFTA